MSAQLLTTWTCAKKLLTMQTGQWTLTLQTPTANFEGFSQILKDHQKREKNSNNLKIRKLPFCIVVDYTDMRFLKFAIEYLCKNKTVCETFFAYSYGVQVDSLKIKKCLKIW